MFDAILVPIDLNEESSWSKTLPVAIAQARQNQAKLHVMSVVPDFGMSIVGGFFPEGYEKKALEQGKAKLEEIVAANTPADLPVECHVAHGTIYEEILRAAETLNCALIVIAAQRPALKDYLLGPNAARVVRHAPQSVFVVRP